MITKNPSLYAGSVPDALAPAFITLVSMYDPIILSIAAVNTITKQKFRHWAIHESKNLRELSNIVASNKYRSNSKHYLVARAIFARMKRNAA